MLAIHPQARTTPAVRAEIARSHESSGVLAKRYGVSTETIRKWRKRGPDAYQDRPARPHKLAWRASDEERAIVCALRRATGFPLDALTFVVSHFLPHLNRDAVYRILKAEGLNRLPPAEKARKPHANFNDYKVDYIHVDVKHLPKLQDCDRVSRKRYLYVAIDHASRYVHLAVTDDETPASAVAFFSDALGAFPFKVTHVLTDRGSGLTADAACEPHGLQHRKTRPYTPKTNGMVERLTGRVQREVLGITLYRHADLAIVLRGFNAAYNSRRQRVLNGLSPEMVLRQCLEADPALANPTYKPPSSSLIKQALRIVEDAKEVSHPDNCLHQPGCNSPNICRGFGPQIGLVSA
ncbi:MAG: IS481 family transposase [Methylobacterium radiotolerans]